MIRTIFLFALLLFSAFSCSDDEAQVDPDNPLENFPSHISKVEAPATALVGNTVPITVSFVVNNGCGRFGSFEAEQKSDAIYIKVFPKYVGEACFQALVTIQEVYEFKPATPGTYTLKFWSDYPDVYITKTIVVTDGD